MRKAGLFFILNSLIGLTCKPGSKTTAGYPLSNHSSAANEKYQVYRIDSVNHIYIIYAKKGTGLYKIVSLKDTVQCQQLQVGGEYKFILMSRVPKTFKGENVSPNQVPHVAGIMFHGNWIKFERDSINDIFSSINLRGLCLQ
ncbi:hypothetical protein [Flavihumibacter sp. CACIAM 22H1]|uniref:hypothetical protein n=1 Tax=Flavihumibacter sp. CACIAM 22H1 TaxID=1812911 RepID=UPI0025C1E017|nr:hypothetical protein [Flavihumibacter sp. CACIAM 22H1]